MLRSVTPLLLPILPREINRMKSFSTSVIIIARAHINVESIKMVIASRHAIRPRIERQRRNGWDPLTGTLLINQLIEYDPCVFKCIQGGWTSYSKISWVSKPRDSCLDFSNCFEIWQAPWQQRYRDVLSNFKATRSLYHPITRLRDSTRFGGKTSYRLVSRDPESIPWHWILK